MLMSARTIWALCVACELELTLGQFCALRPFFAPGGRA